MTKQRILVLIVFDEGGDNSNLAGALYSFAFHSLAFGGVKKNQRGAASHEQLSVEQRELLHHPHQSFT